MYKHLFVLLVSGTTLIALILGILLGVAASKNHTQKFGTDSHYVEYLEAELEKREIQVYADKRYIEFLEGELGIHKWRLSSAIAELDSLWYYVDNTCPMGGGEE